ncbi:MAG: hypothetical protein ABJE66_08900 [Deltaproteobacteria bacterium]
MRAIHLATLFFFVPLATADPSSAPKQPDIRGNEVIEIHDHLAPAVNAKPKDYFHNHLPAYSTDAILSDTWTRAWMLIEIDKTGTVQRFEFLNRPGHDLEAIAASEVFKQRFDPALDQNHAPMASRVIWGIEWPSHGWVAHFTGGLTTSLPPERGIPPHPASVTVPCRGSGPLVMDSLYPVYRDCTLPNLKAIDHTAWINRPPAP